MAIKKRSFFERLSGGVPTGDDYDSFDEDYLPPASPRRVQIPQSQNHFQGSQSVQPNVQMAQSSPSLHSSVSAPSHTALFDDEPMEGQLPVDVYQTPSVTIEGSREERATVTESDYFHHELFWGSFTRTILLPQEIDVENSSAGAKDGLLTIILPKLDKARQTKLRIKST
jgi:hypothetical protein